MPDRLKGLGIITFVSFAYKQVAQRGAIILIRIQKSTVDFMADWDDPAYDEAVESLKKVKQEKSNPQHKESHTHGEGQGRDA